MKPVELKEATVVCRERPFPVEYFERRGPKGVVLYLHGLGCSKDDFIGATSVPELEKHTLVGLDLPGHGNSSYPEGVTLAMDDLVEITRCVVSRLDLGPLVIVGHSMGGLVGLLYAENWGKHVKGFVDIEGNLASEDCFFSRKVASYGSSGFTRDVLERFQQKLAESDRKSLRKHARALGRASEKALVDCASSLVDYSDNANLIPRFAGLKIPKLFLHGSENGWLSYLSTLRDNGCEVVEIPDSGHFPFYDNPQDCYRVISDFVGRC